MSEYNPRTQRRIDQIKARLSIAQVLMDYGYPVRGDNDEREEQFPCDLHGDGHDGKPSARIYPESNSWYCVDVDAPILTSSGCELTADLIIPK